MFFYSSDYKDNNSAPALNNINDNPFIYINQTNKTLTLNSFISLTISIITLIILLFIVENHQ